MPGRVAIEMDGTPTPAEVTFLANRIQRRVHLYECVADFEKVPKKRHMIDPFSHLTEASNPFIPSDSKAAQEATAKHPLYLLRWGGDIWLLAPLDPPNNPDETLVPLPQPQSKQVASSASIPNGGTTTANKQPLKFSFDQLSLDFDSINDGASSDEGEGNSAADGGDADAVAAEENPEMDQLSDGADAVAAESTGPELETPNPNNSADFPSQVEGPPNRKRRLNSKVFSDAASILRVVTCRVHSW